MSSDTTETADQTTDSTTIGAAQSRIKALETHISLDDSAIKDRLSVIRSHITEYKAADTETERQNLLAEIEDELDQLREVIETEAEQGKSAAQDLLSEIETKVSNLRN